MRKFLWGLTAVLGILCALLLHGSLMMVKQESSLMLPDIEPGQKVLIYLLEDDFKEGDIVAFKPPYFTVGGANIMLLRIKDIENQTFVLVPGEEAAYQDYTKVDREDILGKAVFYG